MKEGRYYCNDEDGEYLLVPCERCGSQAVHECCLHDEENEFICDDCDLAPPSKKQKSTNDQADIFVDQMPDMNNNIESKTPSKTKFVRNKITVVLPNLTEEHISHQILSIGKRKSNQCF